MVYWYSYPAEFPNVLFDNSMISDGYTYKLSNILLFISSCLGKEKIGNGWKAITMRGEGVLLSWRSIPGLCDDESAEIHRWNRARTRKTMVSRGGASFFASVSLAPDGNNNSDDKIPKGAEEERDIQEAFPRAEQLIKHPLALLALFPKDLALFSAGAIAGALSKTLTAPLDRVKLLMQTHGLRASGSKGIGLLEAITLIHKEEGIKGYWKGNLPQVIRIIPYSAVQLFAYEIYKKILKNEDGDLSVIGRLIAGACAGMTSTLVTYPLDVLRLRLAVEPGCRTMSQVAFNMVREEGIASFYCGLGPSLIGIAPYIAVNFCIFDLMKKSLPEKYQNRPETSLATALVSATVATLMCYPLDTVRRQMQMKGSPFNNVFDALPGIVERDGFLGLYRGFVPNALKSLPSSSIRLTAFDTVKGLITASQKELERIMEENQLS